MFTDPLDFEVSEQAPPKNENSSIVKNTQSCRICGSSMHWSKDCQFKDVLEVIEPEALLKEEATSTAKATDGGTGTSSTTTTTSSAPGIYVPGSLTRRMGMESSSDDHSLSIRIANLAEHTTEEDVRLLVHKFGKVQRVFMSKNEKGRSRGFAFVNFYEVEAMQQAIQELNGHGYANLILSCERAKKKEAKH
ncbi:hypothetical protein HMI54_005905 [Coelomomyces lativittatus]|nr:hypothetical protein HMI54_005905 [Coelomomyces lativittatus]KAJ1507892.1 hypothetical protein HMI55_000597 [Coelomomyces lativittatus]